MEIDELIIRPLTPAPADAMILREVRLRALRDTPLAFGSTHARESALTEQQWTEKARQWTAPGLATTFLALVGEECIGIIGCFRRTENSHQFAVVSMWVAPGFRRRGLAHRLLAEVEMWAIACGASELLLDVTETNQPAIECYLRYGFEHTGETIPYPNAPNLRELRMKKICTPPL